MFYWFCLCESEEYISDCEVSNKWLLESTFPTHFRTGDCNLKILVWWFFLPMGQILWTCTTTLYVISRSFFINNTWIFLTKMRKYVSPFHMYVCKNNVGTAFKLRLYFNVSNVSNRSSLNQISWISLFTLMVLSSVQNFRMNNLL